jgi:teichuronic acid biosynthesis glycosyltransferase TuaG
VHSSDNISFSVVIPAYNAEMYITQTLNSVLGQSYSNFEVLVVDDCSTDRTRELIEGFTKRDSRVRLIVCSERSGGPATPRNLGLRASRCDYVALLDADDIWTESKLQNDADFLSVNRADILFSGAYYFEGETTNIVYTQRPRPIGRSLFLTNRVPILTVCIARRVFEEHHLYFDADPLLVATEDYHFLLSAHLQGLTILCRPGIDALYRKNSANSIFWGPDSGQLTRRFLYNMTRIAMKYSLPCQKLYTLLALIILRTTLKRLASRT